MVVSRSASLPIGSPARRVVKGTILLGLEIFCIVDRVELLPEQGRGVAVSSATSFPYPGTGLCIDVFHPLQFTLILM